MLPFTAATRSCSHSWWLWKSSARVAVWNSSDVRELGQCLRLNGSDLREGKYRWAGKRVRHRNLADQASADDLFMGGAQSPSFFFDFFYCLRRYELKGEKKEHYFWSPISLLPMKLAQKFCWRSNKLWNTCRSSALLSLGKWHFIVPLSLQWRSDITATQNSSVTKNLSFVSCPLLVFLVA